MIKWKIKKIKRYLQINHAVELDSTVGQRSANKTPTTDPANHTEWVQTQVQQEETNRSHRPKTSVFNGCWLCAWWGYRRGCHIYTDSIGSIAMSRKSIHSIRTLFYGRDSIIFAQGKPSHLLEEEGNKIAHMEKANDRVLLIEFAADTHTSLQWKFKPLQREVRVVPGETALAFYTATNSLDEPVVGISTYTVLPHEAGRYFHKLQCFCFEEQTLDAQEEVWIHSSDHTAIVINDKHAIIWLFLLILQVDLPVFFYIDPDFVNDSRMDNVHNIVLSYTFVAATKSDWVYVLLCTNFSFN